MATKKPATRKVKAPAKKGKIPARKVKKAVQTVKANPMPKKSKEKSVTIQTADNGFIISTYDDRGNSRRLIAKTPTEAREKAAKLLGIPLK